MQNGFTAKVCCFEGVLGYMVFQWLDGAIICSQFVTGSYYKEFCTAAGINPIIEE
jgi:hypothetical protein